MAQSLHVSAGCMSNRGEWAALIIRVFEIPREAILTSDAIALWLRAKYLFHHPICIPVSLTDNLSQSPLILLVIMCYKILSDVDAVVIPSLPVMST